MPYRHGFSEDSIHHNIALFIREGYPQDQAVAMALEIARKAWRREHPRGKYPKHLKGMRGPRKRRGKRSRNMASGTPREREAAWREIWQQPAYVRLQERKDKLLHRWNVLDSQKYEFGHLPGEAEKLRKADAAAKRAMRRVYKYEEDFFAKRGLTA